MSSSFDAILVVAFGGPEKRDDVIPFLENVLRGKNVPRERMLEVAHHYELFDGVSPINAQMRALISAVRDELDCHDINLPIYWGNRNWHPLLTDTMRAMAADGVKRTLALFVSAYSSYSSCRQYREDIQRAQLEVGDGAPHVEKIRAFFNHPEFIAANAERLRTALEQVPADRRDQTHIAFTAHSIPISMADQCDYAAQLSESCRLVATALQVTDERWRLVYQSRSGRPSDPWLGPDIVDHIRELSTVGVQDVVVMPIGFLSDHMEVLYDLDMEAREASEELGLNMVRAETVGTHPRFVGMLRELIEERILDKDERRTIGQFGPRPDVCPKDCCPKSSRQTAV